MQPHRLACLQPIKVVLSMNNPGGAFHSPTNELSIYTAGEVTQGDMPRPSCDAFSKEEVAIAPVTVPQARRENNAENPNRNVLDHLEKSFIDDEAKVIVKQLVRKANDARQRIFRRHSMCFTTTPKVESVLLVYNLVEQVL